MSKRTNRIGVFLFALGLVGTWLLASGCQWKSVATPLAPELAGNDPDVQMEFWHSLVDRKVTSNDEAFHGLLLYLDQEDPAPNYDARVSLLKERKMLPARFDEPADVAIRRGTLAVALAQTLEIKGGLTMRVVGPTPRYATRELQYVAVYPPGSPNQTFSGSEFLGIMGRVEDYERKFAIKAPAADLPEEEPTDEDEIAEQAKPEATTVEKDIP